MPNIILIEINQNNIMKNLINFVGDNVVNTNTELEPGVWGDELNVYDIADWGCLDRPFFKYEATDEEKAKDPNTDYFDDSFQDWYNDGFVYDPNMKNKIIVQKSGVLYPDGSVPVKSNGKIVTMNTEDLPAILIVGDVKEMNGAEFYQYFRDLHPNTYDEYFTKCWQPIPQWNPWTSYDEMVKIFIDGGKINCAYVDEWWKDDSEIEKLHTAIQALTSLSGMSFYFSQAEKFFYQYIHYAKEGKFDELSEYHWNYGSIVNNSGSRKEGYKYFAGQLPFAPSLKDREDVVAALVTKYHLTTIDEYVVNNSYYDYDAMIDRAKEIAIEFGLSVDKDLNDLIQDHYLDGCEFLTEHIEDFSSNDADSTYDAIVKANNYVPYKLKY